MTACKISEHYCSSVGCLKAATLDKLALVLLNPLSTEEHLKTNHPQFEHSYNQSVRKTQYSNVLWTIMPWAHTNKPKAVH